MDFSRVIGDALHHTSWFRVPGFLVRLLFGEMGDVLLLSGQRALSGRLTEIGFEFRYPDVPSAQHQIIRGTE
jgi:NAD dependent epimerase/dehydratase family enzyme